MLPRSSMATSRLTRTFFAASAFDPDERLTVTMAGIISGAIPTAIAREKRSASIRGLESATLTMKMNAVSSRRHPEQEPREARQTHLESRLALVFGQTSRDLSEGSPSARLDHNAEGRPLVNDRSHEGTSRLILPRPAG